MVLSLAQKKRGTEGALFTMEDPGHPQTVGPIHRGEISRNPSGNQAGHLEPVQRPHHHPASTTAMLIQPEPRLDAQTSPAWRLPVSAFGDWVPLVVVVCLPRVSVLMGWASVSAPPPPGMAVGACFEEVGERQTVRQAASTPCRRPGRTSCQWLWPESRCSPGRGQRPLGRTAGG